MNTILLTSQFKKDLKRYKHNTALLNKLEAVLNLLAENRPLPEKNRAHQLVGKYLGYMECHIESDTLLVWWDKESEIIKLVRLGSHSEIF